MLTRRFISYAFAIVALLAVLVITLQRHYRNAASAPKQKIAEGAYTMEPASSHLKVEVDSFTLLPAPGQGLKAEIAMPAAGIPARDTARPHRQSETLEMNSDFT